jgi:hypothetical protein
MKGIILGVLTLAAFTLVEGERNRWVPRAEADELNCNTIVETFKAPKNPPHIPICRPVRYRTNPPTSGRHYAVWAKYKTYTIDGFSERH